MDRLETYIIDSWNKIPYKFKERADGLEFILREEKESEPSCVAEFVNKSTIIFYSKPLEKRFRKEINKVMIRELARHFGFDEKEAYEMMSKGNENN